jgi:hypothetical protein
MRCKFFVASAKYEIFPWSWRRSIQPLFLLFFLLSSVYLCTANFAFVFTISRGVNRDAAAAVKRSGNVHAIRFSFTGSCENDTKTRQSPPDAIHFFIFSMNSNFEHSVIPWTLLIFGIDYPSCRKIACAARVRNNKFGFCWKPSKLNVRL